MKELIKTICIFFGRLLSYIYPRFASQFFESVLAYIHTGYLSRHFKSWGHLSSIAWGGSVKNPQYIAVGDHNIFLRNCSITVTPCIQGHTPSISIGSNCHFGKRNHITCINRIVIGNNLLTGSHVLISDNDHGTSDYKMLDIPPFDRPLVSKGETVIGNNVWIGENACILSGVHIGDNVIIGANSVVTKDIPTNCMAAGIPAKVIKTIEG